MGSRGFLLGGKPRDPIGIPACYREFCKNSYRFRLICTFYIALDNSGSSNGLWMTNLSSGKAWKIGRYEQGVKINEKGDAFRKHTLCFFDQTKLSACISPMQCFQEIAYFPWKELALFLQK